MVKEKRYEETSTPKIPRPTTTWPKRRQSSTPSGSIFKETTPDRNTLSFSPATIPDSRFSPSDKVRKKCLV